MDARAHMKDPKPHGSKVPFLMRRLNFFFLIVIHSLKHKYLFRHIVVWVEAVLHLN